MARRGEPTNEETKRKMREAHLRRWADPQNQARYREANRQDAAARIGTQYLTKPSQGQLVDYAQGAAYKTIHEACQDLDLHERLVRLVLEGRRESTGGYAFRLVSKRHENYLRRVLRNRLLNPDYEARWQRLAQGKAALTVEDILTALNAFERKTP